MDFSILSVNNEVTMNEKIYGVFEISYQRSEGFSSTKHKSLVNQALYLNGVDKIAHLTTRDTYDNKEDALNRAADLRFRNRDERHSTCRLTALGLWSSRFVVHEVKMVNNEGVWVMSKNEIAKLEQDPLYTQYKEWIERNCKV